MSHNFFDQRHYVIIPYSEVEVIDFDQVLETNVSTVRKSIDGTKTFVKYNGSMPSSLLYVNNKSQEYTREEIIAILSTEEWAISDDK